MQIDSIVGTLDLDAQVGLKSELERIKKNESYSPEEIEAFSQGYLAAQRSLLLHLKASLHDHFSEFPRVAKEELMPHPRNRAYRSEPENWTIVDCDFSEARNQIQDMIDSSKKPAVVFDLDGTLVDVSFRTLGILKEWLAGPIDVFPASLIERLKGISLSHIGFSLSHAFQNAGLNLTNEDVAAIFESAEKHWRQRFFDGLALVDYDRPVAGAPKYVQDLLRQGVEIIYLTGRNKKTMEKGTRQQLETLGFPSSETLLFMKEDHKLEDHVYKQQAFESILQKHEVIANFENEYLNLHGMIDFTKQMRINCVHVVVDTQHSGRSVPQSKAKLLRIRNFSSGTN